MTRRLQMGITALVVLLIVGALGAYAVDASSRDTYSPGIRVAGMDLGGLTRSQARRRLQDHVNDPLDKSVRVTVAGKSWRLAAKDADVRTDVPGMLDAAERATNEGGAPGRVWRRLTGGKVERDIPAEVDYSHAAVNRFVERVRKGVDREPTDASVKPTGTSLNLVPGEKGRELVQAGLTRQIARQLTAIGPARTVRPHVRTTKPKLTTADLADKYPTYITVDRASFTLRLWRNLKVVKSYRIAVGAAGHVTPQGLYHIQNKQVDPVWNVPNSAWAGKLAGHTIPGGSPENPLKARWLGIYNGVGIHGTAEGGSIGSAASHGCLRMAVPDVIDLYPRVPVQTPVYIA